MTCIDCAVESAGNSILTQARARTQYLAHNEWFPIIRSFYSRVIPSQLSLKLTIRTIVLFFFDMRMKFAVFISLLSALIGHATETPPFYVSKVSASGAYSSTHFKTLWDAFRQEYSVSANGTFKQYYFTENVLESVSRNSRNYSGNERFFRLFYDQDKIENSQNLTGNQDAFKEANKYVSNQLAMDGARRYGARLATISIGQASSTAGVYSCEVNLVSSDNVDLRETSEASLSGSGGASITFCDPKNVRTGRTTLYVESRSNNSKSSRGFVGERSQLREVGSILDSKDNQDNFLAAIKAGSTFQVFWFKETTCSNCGGFGRLSTLAANQSGGSKKSGSPFGGSGGNSASSILSLTPGVSTARDKCPACYGTGKRMRGHVTTLLWDDKGPSFDPSR